MTLYPEVQARIQSELDQVCKNRLPTVTDKEATPYLNAVITETIRWHTVLPIGTRKGNTSVSTMAHCPGANVPRRASSAVARRHLQRIFHPRWNDLHLQYLVSPSVVNLRLL